MEKRGQPRTRRRLTCEIGIDRDRCPSIVGDLSLGGIFVHTQARPRLGSVVEVIFPASPAREEIRIRAGVARKRVAPQLLQSSQPSGLGLEILAPRTEYERCVFQPACPPLSEADWLSGGRMPGPKQAMRTYRFRLVRLDRPGAKVLSIRSASEFNARARVLSRAGNSWTICDVQAL